MIRVFIERLVDGFGRIERDDTDVDAVFVHPSVLAELSFKGRYLWGAAVRPDPTIDLSRKRTVRLEAAGRVLWV